MTAPARIYVAPRETDQHAGRPWCEDRTGADWVEYVRADLVVDRYRHLRTVTASLGPVGEHTARAHVLWMLEVAPCTS